MSTITFPQYAKSTSPTVLAAHAADREAWGDYQRRSHEFATRMGVPDGERIVGSGFGTQYVAALPGEKPTDGRWKRHHNADGWVPWANNPLAAEFAALRHSFATLPGMPGLLRMGAPGYRTLIVSPAQFERDGTIYAAYSDYEPAAAQVRPVDGVEWVEIPASEFHAAKEAVEAAYNAMFAA